MAASYRASGILQINEKYLRLATLINHAGLELYYQMFHDTLYGGFSTDPQQLYKQLKTHEVELQALRHDGQITEEQFRMLFPPSMETFSHEFDISLYHILAQHCMENFPVITNGKAEGTNSTLSYLETLGQLVLIMRDKTIVKASNCDFVKKWNEVIAVLKKVNYDIEKVKELENIELDADKRYRMALLRSQIDLIIKEYEELMKMSNMNSLTLNKLLLNLEEATSLCQDQNDNHISGKHKQIKNLNEEVLLTMKMISLIKDDVKELKVVVKYWREKNIEGDIIMLDEKLSKLKNQVNEQSIAIGDLFSLISLDIVKIKEKFNFLEDNVRFLEKPRRSMSVLELKSSHYDQGTL